MLLPSVCPGCLTVGPAPCRGCVARLAPAPFLPAPPGVDRCVALIEYQGVGAVLIQRLKYANYRDALDPLSRGLSRLLVGEDAAQVTWVPASVGHRHDRGFDQGELLARAVARHLALGRPVRLLDRAPGPAQTGRDRADRLVGPRLRPRRGRWARGTVVLVDDVRTTGASLSAAARVLRSMGADRVVAATLSATPAPAAA